MKPSSALRILSLVILAGLAGLCIRCTTTTPGEKFVQTFNVIAPPVKNVDVEKKKLTFRAEEGAKFQFPSGSTVSIPPAALVDAGGKPVSGQVDFEYREFHTAADIVAAGIQMEFNNNGKTDILYSGGMVEIRAYQKGNEVFIADGSKVDVELASFVPEDNYDLYYFDPEKGWVLTGKPEMKPNTARAEAEAALPALPAKPMMPVKAEKDDDVFDFAIDYKDFPELKGFKDLKWLYAGAEGKMPESTRKKVFGTVWTDMKVSRGTDSSGVMSLILSRGREKFEFPVQPALDGKSWDKAMAKFNEEMAGYEGKREERLKAEAAAATMGINLRTFSITSFGTHNCDAIYKQPEPLIVRADFNFGVPMDKKDIVIYVIPGSLATAIRYPSERWNEFTFSAKGGNKFLAVLPDNRVATLSADEVMQHVASQPSASASYTFKMNLLPQKVESFQDIQAVMESM